VAAPFGFEREGAVGLLLLMQGRCWRAENGRGYGRKKFKPWEGGRREAVQLGEKRKKNQKGLFGLILAGRRTNEPEGGAAGGTSWERRKKSGLGAAAAPLEKISLGHF